jgi:hypothetical protein
MDEMMRAMTAETTNKYKEAVKIARQRDEQTIKSTKPTTNQQRCIGHN